MENMFQKQLDQFMVLVCAAREKEGTPIDNEELRAIEKWFTLVQDSILAINTLVCGQTVLHWNATKHVPQFSLTELGLKDKATAEAAEATEEAKLKKDGSNVWN